LRKRLLVLSGCIFSLSGAFAQSNLGDLLDLGAKKILKADYVATLPATVYAVWPDGKGERVWTFSPDGKITGNEKHYASGATSGSVGKWTMTDSGKICTSVRFTSWQGSREECRYFFRVGTDVYITLSDTARATPVQKQINR
jgi:hypothetical protein